MNFIETKLAGVIIIEPNVFRDDRGYFLESYNRHLFQDAGIANDFVQDNQSQSKYGVIRGLHCQTGEHAQAKLVRVLQGRVLDVAVDIRIGSPTYGQHISVELSEDNHKQLFIPRGFLHGFSVLSETAVFAYKCDNAYFKDAETGVRYDDSRLAIDWQIPVNHTQVSKRDLELKGFDDVAGYRG